MALLVLLVLWRVDASVVRVVMAEPAAAEAAEAAAAAALTMRALIAATERAMSPSV